MNYWMRHIIIGWLAMLLLLPLAQAQNFDQEAWQTANELYQKGNYFDAISSYQSISNFEERPDVLYNIGNAYMQSGQLGKAILSYERAYRLAPNDKRIQHNLSEAENRIQNAYQDERSAMLRWVKPVFAILSPNAWSFILLLTVLMLSFSFTFRKKKRIAQLVFPLSVIFSLLTAFILYYGLSQSKTQNYAIALQSFEKYYSDGNLSQSIDRLIPEGTKVYVIESTDDYIQFRLPNGVEGFLPVKGIEEI